MKIKPANLDPGGITSLRGLVVFRSTRWGVIAQKWPKKRWHDPPWRKYQQWEFKSAAKIASAPNQWDAATAIVMAKGTDNVPRDFLTAAAMGTLFDIQFADGSTFEPERFMIANAQLTLDQITDTPGAMIYRSPVGWVLVAPGNETDVLQFLAGAPSWQPFEAAGGAVASVFGRTGTVIAVTGDYSAAQISGLGGLATLDIVANNRLADMAINTVKGRIGSVGFPIDLTSAQARTALALGNAATLNVGVLAGTVAAGNDARFAEAAAVAVDLAAHEADHANPHVVTKAQVGLGNADNTTDLAKPISTATETALAAKADDNDVVHLAGTETVTGSKTFAANALRVANINAAGFTLRHRLNDPLMAADQAITWNPNGVSRSVTLSGNLTVAAAATVSGVNTGDQTFANLGIQGEVAVGDADRTLLLTDAWKSLWFNITAIRNLTIPTHAAVALPVGTMIFISADAATGLTVTFTPSAGVTLRGTAYCQAGVGQLKGRILTKIANNTWHSA